MSLEDVLAEHRARFANDAESIAYIRAHAPRYATLLALVADALEVRGTARVLDVGPSYQTQAIRTLHASAVVDTLGFADARLPGRVQDTHIEYDLNESDRRGTWPTAESYDLIVFAEVLEHLVTAPSHVLALLHSLLRPDGTLLIQTPNAAALPKRLKLLLGRNPYELLRDDRRQTGHIREYTLPELTAVARNAGFDVVSVRIANYFTPRGARDRPWISLGRVLPPSLREGITLVLRPSPL